MINIKRVCDELNTSSSTVYRRIKTGHFIAPVKLGERAVGWPKPEFEEFISQISTGLTAGEIHSLVARIHEKRHLSRENAE